MAAEGTASPGSFDFAFALFNPSFSDCKLRLHDEESKSQSNSKEEEQPLKKRKKRPDDPSTFIQEIVASSSILSARSGYFKALFQSEFREAKGEKIVNVHIIKEDVRAFEDMVTFIYNSKVPPTAQKAMRLLAKLLRMADRFDVQGLIDASLEVLRSKSDFSLNDALELLSLPKTLQVSPLFPKSVTDTLRTEVSSMVCQQRGKHKFLDLPRFALQMLLEEDDWDVPGEDVLARAIRDWIWHNIPTTKEKLQAVGELMWPHVRFAYVTPKTAFGLVKDVLALLAETEGANSQCLQGVLKALEREEGETSQGPEMFQANYLVSGGVTSPSCASMCGTLLSLHGYMDGTENFKVMLGLPSSPRNGYLTKGGHLSADVAFDCAQASLFPVKSSKVRILRRDFFLCVELENENLALYFQHSTCEETLPEDGMLEITVSFSWGAKPPFTALRILNRRMELDEAWGFKDPFEKPLSELLEDKEEYFGLGPLGLHVDFWIEQ